MKDIYYVRLLDRYDVCVTELEFDNEDEALKCYKDDGFVGIAKSQFVRKIRGKFKVTRQRKVKHDE